MKVITQWLKNKLGVYNLEKQVAQHDEQLKNIEKLILIGADINFKSPSWVVIAIKGKGNDQDIVRFFSLPDNELMHVMEELKYLEKNYHSRPLFDAPRYMMRDLKEIL